MYEIPVMIGVIVAMLIFQLNDMFTTKEAFEAVYWSASALGMNRLLTWYDIRKAKKEAENKED